MTTRIWTPLECLPLATQTPSGLLQLEETEVDVLQRSNVQLRSAMADKTEPIGPPINALGQVDAELSRHGTWNDRTDANLNLQLTTHRLVLWQTQPVRVARFLHLSHVLSSSVEKKTTSLFGSKKLLLNTYLGDFFLVFSSSSSSTSNANPNDVLTVLQKTLERREWTKSSDQAEEKAKRMTTHRVGVDAVLAKSQIKQRQEQKISDQALAADDAEDLIREASELTRIIHRHVAVLERNNELAAADSSSGAGDNDDDGIDAASQQALVRLLQDMGMTSALSKKDTSNYHETVARQLADLLLPRMAQMGGVVTLTDVYCLINRARSTHLLSPDDLLRAADLLSTLNVGLKTRTFRSGLVVLQDARIDDTQVAELLRDACARGMTALEASALLKSTPLLAQEQLWAAEQMGYLARDEQVETVRFFPNRFDEWTSAA